MWWRLSQDRQPGVRKLSQNPETWKPPVTPTYQHLCRPIRQQNGSNLADSGQTLRRRHLRPGQPLATAPHGLYPVPRPVPFYSPRALKAPRCSQGDL